MYCSVFGPAHVCVTVSSDCREVGRMYYGVWLFSLLLLVSTLCGCMALFSLIVGVHFVWLHGSFLSYCWCPSLFDHHMQS